MDSGWVLCVPKCMKQNSVVLEQKVRVGYTKTWTGNCSLVSGFLSQLSTAPERGELLSGYLRHAFHTSLAFERLKRLGTLIETLGFKC